MKIVKDWKRKSAKEKKAALKWTKEKKKKAWKEGNNKN